MKILIVSPTQKGMGGIAQHVQGLSNFLNSHGNEVEIISSENTFTIPVKGLKNPSFMISSFLKTKLKKKFDIIHAHNIPAALSIKNTRAKRVLSIHGIFSKQIKILHGNTISKISEKYEKNALSWADVITVVSKEALDYYIENKDEIDLVITDRKMPVMGGIESFKEMRLNTPELQGILISGFLEESRDEVKKAGFNSLVATPYSIENLETAIGEITY